MVSGSSGCAPTTTILRFSFLCATVYFACEKDDKPTRGMPAVVPIAFSTFRLDIGFISIFLILYLCLAILLLASE
jgi:hypothetical protein